MTLQNLQPELSSIIPPPTRARLEAAGIDLATYPHWPQRPTDLQIASSVRSSDRKHQDPGLRADKDKKALFGAAKEVINLSPHLGTEIVGLQLSQLSDTQRDELALLIAERTVVFFRDQDSLTPQAQRDLGAYFGDVEVHPSGPQVPGLPGITVIWDKLLGDNKPGFRHPFGSQNWHTDLVHEKQPPGVTHLHNDSEPTLLAYASVLPPDKQC